VPAFNAAATIASAIDSVLRQTETDLELIVVDDGCTDATTEIVTGCPDRRVRIVSQENQGLPAARNRGIAESRGTYVSFLDSDDLWLPDYLHQAASAIRTRENVGFAYTDAYAFDALTGKLRRGGAMVGSSPPVPPPADPRAFLLELLERNFVYVSTTVPRQVLQAVGGFNETRTASEDYDLWLRIVAHGFQAIHIPGRHALYRLHRGQMSRDVPNLKRNELAIYNELPIEDMPTEAHRVLLTRRRREAEWELRIAQGDPWLASAVRRLRYRLGAARQRVGLGGYAWCKMLPPDVAAAFPDLTSV
jgi:glycosyltransferase involved in cell wall biosynthesis